MDTVYGTKKYFQSLGDNDYYNRHSSSTNRVMVSFDGLFFLTQSKLSKKTTTECSKDPVEFNLWWQEKQIKEIRSIVWASVRFDDGSDISISMEWLYNVHFIILMA